MKYIFLATTVFILSLTALFIFQNYASLKQSFTKITTHKENLKPCYGHIISKSGNNYEVKNVDGSHASILITSATKFSGGSIADLFVSKKVSGAGKLNGKVIEVVWIQVVHYPKTSNNPNTDN
jgi:hypothetical protein